MQVIDNINSLLGEDLKKAMATGAKVRIAASCFSNAPRPPLPLALDLKSLYDLMLRAFITVPAREGEPLAELVEHESRIRQFQRQLKQLESKLAAEKQFNRKVAINTELRCLTISLDELVKP